ncbi:glycosyltransferase family 39 protein [Paenibacillus radicis (ex Xue et al. 2023)]|uniref:Glycosyltransferase family 39 protein n=1 Tax=Paenibacillus radicis (ex Xue et al. 2023) TaxID=2972489 RepID=A0ABT1YIK7_9BACL|nr:glycosyltransferase family 39 protein [Paenibacillus radicis (ex Xue et al. 2023)]MCR8633025.1 glycosyltransferase family 39 protein [Paenibacillus radicis (ex Xue et al. 2023)]
MICEQDHTDSIKWIGWTIIGLGLIIRLLIASWVYGYDIDINTFKAWTGSVVSVGPGQFYSQDMFVDYPPGYIYVLYGIGFIRSLFNLPYDSLLFLVLLKTPAIVADMLSAYLLWRLASSRLGPQAALGIAALYLFNPAVIINSAAWGQVDSVFMLSILLVFEYVIRGKLPKASVCYAIAVLIKPQALLFAPLLLCVLIRKQHLGTFLQSLGSGLLTFAVLAAPFVYHKGPFWIFSLYFSTLSSYPYASLNAYNLMSLLGGNFAPISDNVLFLSYQTWGIVLTVTLFAYAVYIYFKSKRDETQLLAIACMLVAGAFMVITKMHERYLFYSLLLALAGFIYIRDRRLLHIFAGLSLTHFINVDHVLLKSFQKSYHVAADDVVLITVSCANTALFIYLCMVVWKVVINRQIAELAVPSSTSKKNSSVPPAHPFTKAEKPCAWGRKDILLLGGLVAVYSVVAFYNLGSLQTPSTGWKATLAGEKITFQLDGKKEIERINSFSGIGDGSFLYEISDDGETWSPPLKVMSDVFKVFMWQVMPANQSGQYIRITVEKPSFTLYEIAVYEAGNETPLPIQSIRGENINPVTEEGLPLLIDEPSKAAYRSTFMNGMYFDEIYHGRTAYEHLYQIEPYESTHPPLGKLLISSGIWLFGMNPFGWRFVGTLFGIFMIPAMYVLGKRLFGKSEYAFVASFLLAVDGLHFVQSRIATIDVYGVLFIMMMFYFMYRFFRIHLFAEDWRRSRLPLALSGLFFGLGLASKWIALYAGLGAAILFFLWLFLHYREYQSAGIWLSVKHKPLKKNLEYWRQIRTVFPHRAIMTVAWCCLFFVIVPFTIYILAYVPFMMVPGPGHGLTDVVLYQKHMLDYHSNLKATHPFSSSWWQWPSMSRPVWYYGAAEIQPEQISSIAAIGNPLVWWVGFLSVLMLSFKAIQKWSWPAGFILIAFFSQYIPWMLVPRTTFLYHYFPMVPFSILAITYFYKQMKESNPSKSKLLYSYLALTAVAFIIFYPVLSGLIVDRTYAEHVLKWFPRWQFF